MATTPLLPLAAVMLERVDPATIGVDIDFLGRQSVALIGKGQVGWVLARLDFLEALPRLVARRKDAMFAESILDFLVLTGGNVFFCD